MRQKQSEENYGLKDLCRDAQVTERTVRYYIQEELLPPPEGAGPFARYNRQHLLRLLLIRRLKEEYLPLAEIRRRLADLSSQDLETLAQQTLALDEYDEEEADARKYLDRLLTKNSSAKETTMRPDYSLASRAPAPLPSQWPPVPGAAASTTEVEQEQVATDNFARSRDAVLADQTIETEIWERVTLAPGVELHYQPRDQEQRRLIARLLEQARQIFTR